MTTPLKYCSMPFGDFKPYRWIGRSFQTPVRPRSPHVLMSLCPRLSELIDECLVFRGTHFPTDGCKIGVAVDQSGAAGSRGPRLHRYAQARIRLPEHLHQPE